MPAASRVSVSMRSPGSIGRRRTRRQSWSRSSEPASSQAARRSSTRARLLRGERGAHELERPLDVHRIALAEVHGEPVENDTEESADRLELEVVANDTLAPLLLELSCDRFLHVRVPGKPLGAPVRVAAQEARHLEVDAGPLRLLGPDPAHDGFEPLVEPEGADVELILRRQREEEIPFARVVAEDRAP